MRYRGRTRYWTATTAAAFAMSAGGACSDDDPRVLQESPAGLHHSLLLAMETPERTLGTCADWQIPGLPVEQTALVSLGHDWEFTHDVHVVNRGCPQLSVASAEVQTDDGPGRFSAHVGSFGPDADSIAEIAVSFRAETTGRTAGTLVLSLSDGSSARIPLQAESRTVYVDDHGRVSDPGDAAASNGSAAR